MKALSVGKFFIVLSQKISNNYNLHRPLLPDSLDQELCISKHEIRITSLAGSRRSFRATLHD